MVLKMKLINIKEIKNYQLKHIKDYSLELFPFEFFDILEYHKVKLDFENEIKNKKICSINEIVDNPTRFRFLSIRIKNIPVVLFKSHNEIFLLDLFNLNYNEDITEEQFKKTIKSFINKNNNELESICKNHNSLNIKNLIFNLLKNNRDFFIKNKLNLIDVFFEFETSNLIKNKKDFNIFVIEINFQNNIFLIQ